MRCISATWVKSGAQCSPSSTAAVAHRLAGGAGQFLLLGQEFVAWVQVLVYIGAVIVLVIYNKVTGRKRIGR